MTERRLGKKTDELKEFIKTCYQQEEEMTTTAFADRLLEFAPELKDFAESDREAYEKYVRRIISDCNLAKKPRKSFATTWTADMIDHAYEIYMDKGLLEAIESVQNRFDIESNRSQLLINFNKDEKPTKLAERKRIIKAIKNQDLIEEIRYIYAENQNPEELVEVIKEFLSDNLDSVDLRVLTNTFIINTLRKELGIIRKRGRKPKQLLVNPEDVIL